MLASSRKSCVKTGSGDLLQVELDLPCVLASPVTISTSRLDFRLTSPLSIHPPERSQKKNRTRPIFLGRQTRLDEFGLQLPQEPLGVLAEAPSLGPALPPLVQLVRFRRPQRDE